MVEAGLVVDQAEGMFGPLVVRDEEGYRSLNCAWMVHGSAWLEPPARIDGAELRPGPLPESDYLLAWLLPVARRPDGHVLMGGLGGGCGPIALAWAFPSLRITVVEIDPAVVALARRCFPLLGHFERQGRIRIVVDDLAEAVRHAGAADWSLALLDTYQRDSVLVCPPALLNGLHGRADGVWLNLLDEDDLARTRAAGEQLRACGWDARSCIPLIRDPRRSFSGNVLLGTTALRSAHFAGFAPFDTLDHARAVEAHEHLRQLAALIIPAP